MGNTKSQYSEFKEEKFATLEEINALDIPSPVKQMTRFDALGNSVKEAIEALRKVCKHYGIPEPQLHPLENRYYCGYIEIEYWRSIKRRINPCWFKKQNGRYLAYVYYSKM